ncbi:GNAT family N-acetyltransferase [Pediococcus ethanolidurans]|uniref:GNAT family N-acetyltransferase n=1 Tax=Pediococcus ethanolidurans TaxID=319653 RepID=UPI001C1F1F05|nr:GNAT family N-acetyltransferase [Pediococcus ethanolidurans]MBU7554328.1 GNAT family N-acetyltransferase [Pediococcus ethanolidurans]MCT4398725.1 GNAT family N-acetyltransferase [Pediococcus ethanolidurans]MCV3321098.1 GNAT family N-acetyltransferase [Pediococcus ethanolidurans]MCV3323800.1 GNAT family N-acetyltransferase [Pediococcus ethanolidurans]MCV3555157.1 GNAT family N-acetyltransferase [Pediococcus ethanolidurans]
MNIQPYQTDYHHLAELVDLINYCQNIEANLGIKMAEQADIFNIENYYQKKGGNFWLALDKNKVVGSIALLPIDNRTAVLKKFFTYPSYRGDPHHLGAKLYANLITFATDHHFERIVLDTPEAEHRSHSFYEHHGFKQITAEDLQFTYPYTDRHSRLYELTL